MLARSVLARSVLARLVLARSVLAASRQVERQGREPLQAGPPKTTGPPAGPSLGLLPASPFAQNWDVGRLIQKQQQATRRSDWF
jgi:hypothetical protein